MQLSDVATDRLTELSHPQFLPLFHTAAAAFAETASSATLTAAALGRARSLWSQNAGEVDDQLSGHLMHMRETFCHAAASDEAMSHHLDTTLSRGR